MVTTNNEDLSYLGELDLMCLTARDEHGRDGAVLATPSDEGDWNLEVAEIPQKSYVFPGASSSLPSQ